MSNWKLWAVGISAAVVGMIVGSAFSNSGDDIVNRVTARLDAMDAKIDAMITDAKTAATGSAKIDGIEGATTALSNAVAEMKQNLQALQTRIGEAPDVQGAVQALDKRLDDLGASFKDATQKILTAATSTGTPKNAAGGAEPADAASLQAALGSDGKALGPGETLVLGERRVFVRRLVSGSDIAATAEVTVVGGAAAELTAGKPLDLGGGCTVELLGVADGTGYFKPAGC